MLTGPPIGANWRRLYHAVAGNYWTRPLTRDLHFGCPEQADVTPARAGGGDFFVAGDSGPFQDVVAAISLRENERGTQIGNGWDPQWHQPTDLYATYSDKDFRLGLNAAQTTLAALAQLTGATLTK